MVGTFVIRKRVLAAPASPLGMINSCYSPSPALSALSNDHFCISPCWEGGHIRGRMIDNPNHVVGPLPTVSLPEIHRNGREVLAELGSMGSVCGFQYNGSRLLHRGW